MERVGGSVGYILSDGVGWIGTTMEGKVSGDSASRNMQGKKFPKFDYRFTSSLRCMVMCFSCYFCTYIFLDVCFPWKVSMISYLFFTDSEETPSFAETF